MDEGDLLERLARRVSVGARHLVPPAPSDAELRRMARLALRAPDHAKRMPFRFALIRGEALATLGALFEQAALDAGKDSQAAAKDAERARTAPLTVALVARIDAELPQVPPHEQWAAVGGALAHFLDGAHLLGYAGKMLSGAKTRDPKIVAAFCAPGETLVGWIALGTPREAPALPAGDPPLGQVLSDWPGPPGLPLPA